MAFKTILSVFGVDQSDRDLEAAVALCREASAHLSVLVVAPAAPPPAGDYAGLASEVWLKVRKQEMAGLASRVTTVTALLAGSELSADVASEHCEMAWTDDVVGRRARYADLTVLGAELLRSEALRDKVLNGALFQSARPALLAAGEARPAIRPRRVVVAWDARIEASRAVREGLELLAAAEEVRLTLVDPAQDDFGHGAEPGADAAAYLARHGIKVAVDRLPSGGRPVAAVLRQHAVDVAADMIVMGAYGHSRWRERLFGGVTRSMIEAPPLPIFMAH